MNRVYISGPMTGHEDMNREAFEEAEKELHFDWAVDEIVNPAKFPFRDTAEYRNIINFCLSALSQCDSIYMLKGWEKSTGACIEYGYARARGMDIRYER